MSNYPMQAGTRRFGEQPGTSGTDRWDKNLEKMDPPPFGKPFEIRPVPGLCTIVYHYLNFISSKDGEIKGFPVLCPNWDIAEQAQVDGNCPVCRDFHGQLPVKDEKWEFLRMPIKYRYLFHAFNLTKIRAGDKSSAFGLIETHPLGMQAIDKSAQIKGVPVDDPDNGCALMWLRTEAKGKYKEEVTFQAGETIPIKWSKKKQCWAINIDGKWYAGREQNYLAAISEIPTGEDLERKLVELGLYDQLAQGSKQRGPASPGLGSPNRDEDYEDDLEGGEDLDEDELEDEEDEKPKKREQKNKKGKKKPIDEDEDEDEFEDEDEEEKPKKKKGKKADDEDLEEENWDDEDLEDDQPKKSGKKRKAKDEDDDEDFEEEEEEKPKKKKGSKKGKKKVDEEDDDFDVDDDDFDDEEVSKKKKGKKGKKGSKKTKKSVDEDEDEDEFEDEDEEEKPKKKKGKKGKQRKQVDEEEDDEFDEAELDEEDWD
jgi:hypothetical protein